MTTAVIHKNRERPASAKSRAARYFHPQMRWSPNIMPQVLLKHSPAPSAKRGRPFWMPGPCPDWCTETHTDRDHPDDREHVSAYVTLPLSMAAPLLCATGPDGTWQYTAPEIRVRLVQNVREADPHIELAIGDDSEWRLTLAEFSHGIAQFAELREWAGNSAAAVTR